MTTIRGALRYVVYYWVDEGRCFWFVLCRDPGEGEGASSAHIEWALGRSQKTTYRRLFLGGARRRCLDGLESGFEDWGCFPSRS